MLTEFISYVQMYCGLIVDSLFSNQIHVQKYGTFYEPTYLLQGLPVISLILHTCHTYMSSNM